MFDFHKQRDIDVIWDVRRVLSMQEREYEAEGAAKVIEYRRHMNALESAWLFRNGKDITLASALWAQLQLAGMTSETFLNSLRLYRAHDTYWRTHEGLMNTLRLLVKKYGPRSGNEDLMRQNKPEDRY